MYIVYIRTEEYMQLHFPSMKYDNVPCQYRFIASASSTVTGDFETGGALSASSTAAINGSIMGGQAGGGENLLNFTHRLL